MRKAPRLPRNGFALLEAIAAILILSIAMSSLAALMVQVSRGSLRVTGDSYRNSVLAQEVNRIEAMPYDAVAVGTETVTVTARPYPHTRSITVTNPSEKAKKVVIVITPDRNYFKSDTAIVYRRNSMPTNAFNTGT